jgi:abequosyltransferase
MVPILDILIPTYNRGDNVVKNIVLTCSQLQSLSKERFVRLIIVDNCSTDNSFELITKAVLSFPNFKIEVFRNETNIGLYNNIVKVLSHATSPFIMYLGDDDFIPLKYWEQVFHLLEGQKDLGFIKPCRIGVIAMFDIPIPLYTGEATVKAYERKLKNTLYLASNCNQLSGLVYRNIGLYARIEKEKVRNLYPFMAFAGWVLENYKGYSIEGSPVLITDGVKKDWGYGNDGTLGDIVDNVKFFIPNSYLQRLYGEAFFANKWKWFLGIVLKRGFEYYIVCLKTLLFDKRLLLSTRLLFIYFCSYIELRILIYKWKSKLIKKRG